MTIPHFRDYVKGLSGIATALGVDPDDADGVAAALTDLAAAITTLNSEVADIEAELAAGGVVLYGTAAPTTEGSDGDFYIRLVAGVPTTVYGPKASGTWPSGAAMQGPTGATGAAGSNGTNGTNGTDGKTIRYGTAAPTTEGVDGDFYIRLVGSVPTTVYGPKASGSWPSGSGLQGATGATGAAGADATAIYGDPVTIAHGGTGQTTAAAALAALGGAPLASPTLTGDPKAPTPSVDDSDASIATTGFVQANSSKIWASTSTSAPSDSVGQDGDYYVIQDSAGDKNRVMYGPKASGTWTGVAKHLFMPETHATGEFIRSNGSGDQSIVWQALTTGDMPPIVVCTVSDSSVNVPDTTTTIIGLTASESEDTDGYHSDVTNRSRITVPTNYGGWHLVSARASWASNATGYRRLNILVSGTTRYTLYVVPAASGSAMNFAFTLMVKLAAGDYCQAEAQQTSGGALACTLAEFTVLRLHQP